MTSLAFLFSTKVVTWFKPNLSTLGLVESSLFSATLFWALARSLAFFSYLVSGLYFFMSLNRFLDWSLLTVKENQLMVGGTLSLLNRILFCLQWRMYWGHLTNLVMSLVCQMSPPTLKFLALDSNKGFLTFFTAFFLETLALFLT